RGEGGRRVVCVVADGDDNPLTNGPKVGLGDIRSRSRAEEVMMYGIGLAIDCAPASRALPASALWPSTGALFQGRGGGGRGGGGGGGGGGRVGGGGMGRGGGRGGTGGCAVPGGIG